MKKLLSLIFLVLTVNQVHSQWVQVMNQLGNQKVKSYAASGNYVFSGCTTNIFASSNSGDNWYYIGNTPGSTVWALGFNGNDLFASLQNFGIYRSTDFGQDWTDVNNGVPHTPDCFAAFAGNFYAGTFSPGGIYMTTNEGDNWTHLSNPYLDVSDVTSMLGYGNYLFAGSDAYGVFRSSDAGMNWIQVDTGMQAGSGAYAIVSLGNKIFAGTTNGIYVSTNNGDSWVSDNIGIPQAEISVMTVSGNYILAGGYVGLGVYLSTNAGVSWTSFNEGLPDIQALYLYAIGSNNVYFFLGPQLTTDGFGIWKRPIGDITAIRNTNNEVPKQFALYQNYPNPFNPTTIIKFDIPLSPLSERGVGGFTSLKIYDILGREVTTLLNQQLQPGTYSIQWNASNYPSGVYFYKLVTGTYTAVKKMILIK